MSKILTVVALVVFCLFQLNNISFAKIVEHPKSTCDLCGWCDDADPKDPAKKPSDWESCKNCIYVDYNKGLARDNASWTVFGCIISPEESVSFSGSFVQNFLRLIISLTGAVVFVVLVAGSVQVLASRGDPVMLQNGKETIFSSLVGAFLIVFSLLILKFIGVDILGIPGLG